jgi:hypothetical protein
LGRVVPHRRAIRLPRSRAEKTEFVIVIVRSNHRMMYII